MLESADYSAKSADSGTESADSSTDFTIVGRQPMLNMFDIYLRIKSVDGNRPSIADGRRQIGQVGTGLKGDTQRKILKFKI